jgi:Leucine-rich repeat (LRR) protein
LSDTNVTDDGLKHLQGLTQLRTLDLSATNVTDAGLKHLQGLTELQILDLNGTKATGDGVKRLQRALPNCRISGNRPPGVPAEPGASRL